MQRPTLLGRCIADIPALRGDHSPAMRTSASHMWCVFIHTTQTPQVRVFKKTSKESLPSLKDYQEAAAEGGAAGEVARAREMRAVANPDEPLGPEDIVKAFR